MPLEENKKSDNLLQLFLGDYARQSTFIDSRHTTFIPFVLQSDPYT